MRIFMPSHPRIGALSVKQRPSVCPSCTWRITQKAKGLGWRRGVVVSCIRCMNEVNPRRARLVLGWVTIFRMEIPTTSQLGQLSLASLWGSLNRVPALAGVKVGMSHLPGGRWHWVISYGMCVPIAVWQVRLRPAILCLPYLDFTFK